MYLYLAERDECMHEGDYSPSLLLFVDACNGYGDRDLKSPVLVFSLPEAKSPHQTIMQLAIARFVAPDDGHQLKGLLNTHTMVPAIEKALTRGVNGKPLQLKTYPDLVQLNTFLGTHGLQCNDCCPFCPATKEEFVLPTFTRAKLRTLADWIAMSPVPELLRLFKHENDIGWDARHLWANVLTHLIVHALYLYSKKNLPNHYVQNRVSLYRSVFNVSDKSQKYYEPEAEAIQHAKRGCRGDFKFDCKEAKRVLFLNSFWEKLANISPKFRKDPDGMCIAHPLLNNGCPLPDPIQRHIKLMHLLGQQILSWKPEAVSMRDSYALEAHQLYGLVGLSARRYGPGLHILLFHQTPRILHSGNLVGVSTEGGGRMHQPHKRITKRTPTYWFSKCSPGILDYITWGARVLGLWFLREEVPYKHFDPLTLPSF